MRFLLIVMATGYTEAGVKYSSKHINAVDEYRKSLARAGVLLAVEELEPSSSGIRICYSHHGEKPEFRSGPFSLDHKLITGYTLIDVSSEDEAVKWTLKMPVPEGFGAFEIEMRKLDEETSFTYNTRLMTLEADLQDHISVLKNK